MFSVSSRSAALATTMLAPLWGAGSLMVPLPAAADPVGAPCPADAIHVRVGDELGYAAFTAPFGARFCIETGIHRMQYVEPKNGQQFYAEPGAVLNGARVLTEFTRSGPYWVAGGQTQQAVDRGVCAKGYEACKQPLGFFIDSKPLRQVRSLADLGPGKFFFDPAKGEITFADSPEGKLVEATVTRYAIAGAAENVLINGLIVEKYYNPPQDGAVRGDGKGWKVEKSEMRFNSGTGVSVDAEGTISDCNLHDNGQMGATASGTNVLLQSNQISRNNLYGFDSSWDAGGVKITVGSGVTMRGNHVFNNYGPGLWCDVNCTDVLYEDNVVEYNQDAGIFFELSSKAVIRNNTLRENNQAGAGWYWGAEIQIAASEFAEIYGNHITVRDPGRGIMLIDQNRWKVGGGYYRTQGNYAHDNDIRYLGAGASGGVSTGNPLEINFGIIRKGGNRFDGNVYRYAGTVPPQFPWDIVSTDFAGFRAVGQELNGTLVQP